MANAQHLQLLKQGKNVWNAWRREDCQIQPDLEDADFAGMDLSDFLLGDTHLRGANLTNASLRNAVLFGTDLSHASLVKADLRGASLDKARFLQANCTSVNFSGTTVRHVHFTEAQLSYADFHRADLERAIFARANVLHARFDFANLDHVDLSEANLSEASLWNARLNNAQMAGATLSQAYLRGTYLDDTLVQGTDFSNVVLWGTAFINMDLSEARGLESARHIARSFVDLHTWFRSEGNIPSIFLRGVGLPEPLFHGTNEFIVKPAHRIAGFIAYHPADEEFARLLFDDLQHQGILCWLAPATFYRGDSRQMVTQAFQPLDKLFLVVSEQMLSEWLVGMIFIRDAQEREQKSHTQLLFPLYIDRIAWEQHQAQKNANSNEDRWLGNFVGWQEKAVYQQAFHSLLEALYQGRGTELHQEGDEPP